MLWQSDDHEEVTDRVWDQAAAETAIAQILRDAESARVNWDWPCHPLDGGSENPTVKSLYFGTAGMIWGLQSLGSGLDLVTGIEDAIAAYRAAPDFEEDAHPPSLWMGETGLLAVAARVGASCFDQQRLRELVIENRDHETWELMWGSPGTMLAARACDLEPEWRESAAVLWDQWDHDTDLWTQTLYGSVEQLLGPAHGFAGSVHALRGFVADGILRARVTRAMEGTALRDNGLVNWAPVAQPEPGPGGRVRVQWCHGAPGIVATIGDLIPVDLALAGGEMIWQAGPLRKGSGLCHGTAGNGFAFLKLLKVTGDEVWLLRARQFAMHAIEQLDREHATFGCGRFTLWTGDIGVALYLRACIDSDWTFPTIDRL